MKKFVDRIRQMKIDDRGDLLMADARSIIVARLLR